MKTLAAGRGLLPEYLNPILYGLADLVKDNLQTVLLLGQHAMTDKIYELNLTLYMAQENCTMLLFFTFL
jgi:hypothetical protein